MNLVFLVITAASAAGVHVGRSLGGLGRELVDVCTPHSHVPTYSFYRHGRVCVKTTRATDNEWVVVKRPMGVFVNDQELPTKWTCFRAHSFCYGFVGDAVFSFSDPNLYGLLFSPMQHVVRIDSAAYNGRWVDRIYISCRNGKVHRSIATTRLQDGCVDPSKLREGGFGSPHLPAHVDAWRPFTNDDMDTCTRIVGVDSVVRCLAPPADTFSRLPNVVIGPGWMHGRIADFVYAPRERTHGKGVVLVVLDQDTFVVPSAVYNEAGVYSTLSVTPQDVYRIQYPRNWVPRISQHQITTMGDVELAATPTNSTTYCQSFPGVGQVCNMTYDQCATRRCSERGTCPFEPYESGCVCNPDAYGEFCLHTAATCAVAQCSGHGDCLDGGGCTCDSGYFDTDCSLPADTCRVTRCVDHGICSGVSSGCTCDYMYTGDDCALLQCVPNELDDGYIHTVNTLVTPSVCVCGPSYSGDHCETRVCGDHGVFNVSAGECVCSGLYAHDVNGTCTANVCGAGGFVPTSDDSRCICTSGYLLTTKPGTDEPVCVPRCKNNGVIVAPNFDTCVCLPSHIGTFCEFERSQESLPPVGGAKWYLESYVVIGFVLASIAMFLMLGLSIGRSISGISNLRHPESGGDAVYAIPSGDRKRAFVVGGGGVVGGGVGDATKAEAIAMAQNDETPVSPITAILQNPELCARVRDDVHRYYMNKSLGAYFFDNPFLWTWRWLSVRVIDNPMWGIQIAKVSTVLGIVGFFVAMALYASGGNVGPPGGDGQPGLSVVGPPGITVVGPSGFDGADGVDGVDGVDAFLQPVQEGTFVLYSNTSEIPLSLSYEGLGDAALLAFRPTSDSQFASPPTWLGVRSVDGEFLQVFSEHGIRLTTPLDMGWVAGGDFGVVVDGKVSITASNSTFVGGNGTVVIRSDTEIVLDTPLLTVPAFTTKGPHSFWPADDDRNRTFLYIHSEFDSQTPDAFLGFLESGDNDFYIRTDSNVFSGSIQIESGVDFSVFVGDDRLVPAIYTSRQNKTTNVFLLESQRLGLRRGATDTDPTVEFFLTNNAMTADVYFGVYNLSGTDTTVLAGGTTDLRIDTSGFARFTSGVGGMVVSTGGDLTRTVGGSVVVGVTGSTTTTIGAGVITTITGSETRNVTGDRLVNTGGSATEIVSGSLVKTVGGSVDTTTGDFVQTSTSVEINGGTSSLSLTNDGVGLSGVGNMSFAFSVVAITTTSDFTVTSSTGDIVLDAGLSNGTQTIRLKSSEAFLLEDKLRFLMDDQSGELSVEVRADNDLLVDIGAHDYKFFGRNAFFTLTDDLVAARIIGTYIRATVLQFFGGYIEGNFMSNVSLEVIGAISIDSDDSILFTQSGTTLLINQFGIAVVCDTNIDQRSVFTQSFKAGGDMRFYSAYTSDLAHASRLWVKQNGEILVHASSFVDIRPDYDSTNPDAVPFDGSRLFLDKSIANAGSGDVYLTAGTDLYLDAAGRNMLVTTNQDLLVTSGRDTIMTSSRNTVITANQNFEIASKNGLFIYSDKGGATQSTFTMYENGNVFIYPALTFRVESASHMYLRSQKGFYLNAGLNTGGTSSLSMYEAGQIQFGTDSQFRVFLNGGPTHNVSNLGGQFEVSGGSAFITVDRGIFFDAQQDFRATITTFDMRNRAENYIYSNYDSATYKMLFRTTANTWRLEGQGTATKNMILGVHVGSDTPTTTPYRTHGIYGFHSTSGYGRSAYGSWSAAGNGYIFMGNDANVRFGTAANIKRDGSADGGTIVGSQPSDGRSKNSVVNISYGLDTVLALRPVEFKFNGKDKQELGFIAQETLPILPEVVYDTGGSPSCDTGVMCDLKEGEQGLYAMEYAKITPVLAKAIQELAAKISVLEARLDACQSCGVV